MQEMLCKIEQAISDEYESIRQKGKIIKGIEETFRQVKFTNPELAVHIKKRMWRIAEEKGDLP